MEAPSIQRSLAAKLQARRKNDEGFSISISAVDQQSRQVPLQARQPPPHRFLNGSHSSKTQQQSQLMSKGFPPTSSATPISVITSTSSATNSRAPPSPSVNNNNNIIKDHGGTTLVLKTSRGPAVDPPRSERIHCDCCDAIFLNKDTFQEHIRAVYDARPHACNLCPQRFKVPAALRRHALIHTGERPFQCKICSKSFNQSGSLKGHMRVHTGERPYHCRFCDWTFSNSSNLLKHQRKHELDDKRKKMGAQIEVTPFRRRRVRQSWVDQRQEVQQHQFQLAMELQQRQQLYHQQNLHNYQQQHREKLQAEQQQRHYQHQMPTEQLQPHQPFVIKDEQQLYEFDDDDSTDSAYSTANHEMNVDDVSNEIVIPHSPPQTPSTPEDDDDQPPLPLLPRLKPKPQLLGTSPAAVRLKRSASDTLLYLRRLPDDVNISQMSITEFEKKANRNQVQQQHPTVITELPATAALGRPLPILKKAVVSPIEMDTLQQKPEVFACDKCPRWFPTKARMKAHLPSHTDERPYDCTYCDKKFKSTYALRRHIMIHEGIKPYRCNICFKRFNQTGSLTLHMRTHTGERPYSCYRCSAKFSNSSNLSKHVRLHIDTGNLPSAAATSTANDITERETFGTDWMEVVREENEQRYVNTVYSCDQCDFTTRFTTKLLKHKSVHHDQ